MKIAFLSRYQNINQRGVETFVKKLSEKLSKDFEIDVLSDGDSDDIFKIIKGKYDVVVPVNGRLQVLKVSIGRLFGGYKVLISGHSGIGRDDIWNIVIGRPDIFVALTEKMYKWSRKWAFGVKVLKVPNGIDLNEFSGKGSRMELGLPKPIVLCVGALEWYKHHERVIKAVGRLGKGSLVIAGDGSLKKELEELGRKEIGENFRVEKFDYKKLPELYRSCDLFTLPSWDREAFGIVYLEAMASNLPVVAPDDESRREIVGDAGELVDTSDIDKYSEAIKQALSKDWGDKPIRQAERFSWDKVATLYSDAFRSLLNQ